MMNKEFYGERWITEKGFDRLKNKLNIEKLQGRWKVIIEQGILKKDESEVSFKQKTKSLTNFLIKTFF